MFHVTLPALYDRLIHIYYIFYGVAISDSFVIFVTIASVNLSLFISGYNMPINDWHIIK